MIIINISQAKAQLSALIEKVLSGQEVIIGKAGKRCLINTLDSRANQGPYEAKSRLLMTLMSFLKT